MALVEKFVRLAKDSAVNAGDYIATGLKATGMAQAGLRKEVDGELDACKKRVAARKTTRQQAKP